MDLDADPNPNLLKTGTGTDYCSYIKRSISSFFSGGNPFRCRIQIRNKNRFLTTTLVNFKTFFQFLFLDRDRNWQTPFHIAAANNACGCVELIIPRLSNINISDRAGRTGLHMAANAGHLDLVKLLVQHGANVNAMDKRERRPLHWAAAANNEEIVSIKHTFNFFI
jgi:ankyrin repeat protein